MKFLTVIEENTENEVNIEKIEAVVKTKIDETNYEIRVVCERFAYFEYFDTKEKQEKRFNEIMMFLRKDGEIV